MFFIFPENNIFQPKIIEKVPVKTKIGKLGFGHFRLQHKSVKKPPRIGNPILLHF
jgi:hypothetical protein